MQHNDKINKSKVALVSFGHFMHDVYTSFLSPLVPLIIEKLQISLVLIGLLDVIRKIPSLLNPIVGILVERVCIKYIIILAPGIAAVLMSLIGLAPNYFILAVLLFFTGVNSSLFHVPAPVAIKKFSGNKTGTGMSMYMLGGELARSLGPLYITAAVSYWGLEGSYKVMPLGILASVLLYLKLKNINGIISHKSTDKTKNNGDVKKLIPLFIIVGLYILFRGGIKSAFSLYLPTFLTKQGESLWFAGISLSVFQFAGAFGTLGAGILSDKIGKRNTLIISAIASPLLMFAFLYSFGYLRIVWLILLGVFIFAQGPVLLALFQDSKSKRPAFVNSIYMTINFLLNSLVVLLFGKIADLLNLNVSFEISAYLALLAIPVSFFIAKVK